MAWWHIPVYLVDLASMILLSFFLGDLVDTLDKKTKISGAFIGGVLLAAVTSLPELFTSLSLFHLLRQRAGICRRRHLRLHHLRSCLPRLGNLPLLEELPQR